MTDLVHESLSAFVAACAARTPTPGGGAASALIGAVGAALGEMAVRFTIGRKDAAAHEAELQVLAADLDRLRGDLLRLVDEDCAAYDRVTAALRLAKDTPQMQERRAAAIEEATCVALDVPLRGARLAAEALGKLSPQAERLNKNLVSDVGVGARALHAAVEGLLLNVAINAASLRDRAAAAAAGREVDTLRDSAGENLAHVLNVVELRLAET